MTSTSLPTPLKLILRSLPFRGIASASHGDTRVAWLAFEVSTVGITMKRKRTSPNAPEVVEVDRSQLDEVARRAEASLDPSDARYVRAVFESYKYITDLVDDKETSIRRLRQLLFGSQSEKTRDVTGNSSSDDENVSADQPDGEKGTADSPADDQPAEKSPRQGHGRNPANAYRGGKQIQIPHESLEEGDSCPECGSGTLNEKPPSVVVRLVGQAPVQATVYRLQKLRCNTCGKVFTAKSPAEAGAKKYDETSASMIGLLRYGSGLPFNRLEGLQRNLGIPLPASTQWDIIHAYALNLVPAYEQLLHLAAQGDVLHNDDTTVKILDLMAENARRKQEDANPPERTGMFTSGVVSLADGRRIALFFSGRQHAGENLEDVLRHRVDQLDRPIQMCDGLSRNYPKELETIVANCIAHARRKFVEIYDRFPDECLHVLKALEVVYKHDTEARRQGMSPERRLQYHRIKSEHTMKRLHTWLKRQIDQKLIEPNSALGEAIEYMLKRWDALTLFLRESGAPLDNNICERMLKKAILHRKNSLFYRTENGARVGDMFMSLIHTCELDGANPLEYLTELGRHTDEVAEDPDRWMPWNYSENLKAISSAA